MAAYQDALATTSRPWAPWYAIPADDKPFMRATVAGIVEESLTSLKLDYPRVSHQRKQELKALRDRIV
jgi:polyphosphate kinase 2 (PPK2 family)